MRITVEEQTPAWAGSPSHEYDPAVDALAIDLTGSDRVASARMVRLDRDHVLDYDADGHLVSIELLNVSRAESGSTTCPKPR